MSATKWAVTRKQPSGINEHCTWPRLLAGRSEEAEDLFDIYLPINRHEQQPGIGLAIRKEVLRRRGAIRSAAARYPAAKLSPYDHDEISALLARIERRIGAASPRAAQ